ncbi:MAG: hypothetical protein ABI193_01455 [Minicystis sp.]
MLRLPALDVRLRDLPLPELSPRAQEQLARICMCLYVVNRPELQARAILAGYTPEIHAEGVYFASLAAGERSFREWRTWRSLRPPRDPDLPDLVTELERFAVLWRSRALAAAAGVPDAGDRGELEAYLDDAIDRPSRTWTAKASVARVEHLASVPLPFYQDTWAALVAQGITTELPRFHEVLETVQRVIAAAPLDADELADLQAAREKGAASVEAWLNARRDQFAGHFVEETLALLALGERAPPPLSPEVPLALLAHFRPAAQA